MDVFRIQRGMLKRADIFPSNTYGMSSPTPKKKQQGTPLKDTLSPDLTKTYGQQGKITWKGDQRYGMMPFFDANRFIRPDQSKLPVWQRDAQPARSGYSQTPQGEAAYTYDTDRWNAYHEGWLAPQVMKRLPDANEHDPAALEQSSQAWMNTGDAYFDPRAAKVHPDLRPYIHDEKSLNTALRYNPVVDTEVIPETDRNKAWKDGFAEAVWDARLAGAKQMGNFLKGTVTMPQDLATGIPIALYANTRYGIPEMYHKYIRHDPYAESAWKAKENDFRTNGWLEKTRDAVSVAPNMMNAKFQEWVDQQHHFNPELKDYYERNAARAWAPANFARDYAFFSGKFPTPEQYAGNLQGAINASKRTMIANDSLAGTLALMDFPDLQDKAVGGARDLGYWAATHVPGGDTYKQRYQERQQGIDNLGKTFDEAGITWHVDDAGYARPDIAPQPEEPSIALQYAPNRMELQPPAPQFARR